MLAAAFCILPERGPAQIASENQQILITDSVTSRYTPRDSVDIVAGIYRIQELRWAAPVYALRLYDSLAGRSAAIGFTDGVALALLHTGIAQLAAGNPGQAFETYARAYSYCLKSNDRHALISTLFINTATTHYYLGDYTNAATYYYRTLLYLLQHSPANINMPIALSNLGAVLNRLEQQDQAFYYLNRAVQQSRHYNMQYPLALSLNNLGDAWLLTGKYKQADTLYKEALQIARSQRYPELTLSLLNSLGAMYLESGDLDAAESWFLEAIRLEDSNVNPFYAKIQPYYNLGRVYYLSGDYSSAISYISSALDLSSRTGILDGKMTGHRTLAALYEKTGRKDLSFNHLRQYVALRDTLMAREKMEMVSHLNIRYQSAEKDKILAQKQLLIERQQNQIAEKNTQIVLISLGTVSLASISLLLLLLYRNNQQKRRLQQKVLKSLQQENEIMQQEEKIKIMQALIRGEENERIRLSQELHDGIGGMLAAIQMHLSASSKRKPVAAGAVHDELPVPDQDILGMIQDAAAEVRKTAHNLMPEILSKRDLEEAVHLYCEQINTAGKLQIDLQIYNALTQLSHSAKLSIYRIMQELIQNIIKHSDAAHAVIQINQQPEKLFIIIEDDGKGFNTESFHSGIGLLNIQNRVSTLKGIMSIESSEQRGTIAYLEFDNAAIEKND